MRCIHAFTTKNKNVRPTERKKHYTHCPKFLDRSFIHRVVSFIYFSSLEQFLFSLRCLVFSIHTIFLCITIVNIKNLTFIFSDVDSLEVVFTLKLYFTFVVLLFDRKQKYFDLIATVLCSL